MLNGLSWCAIEECMVLDKGHHDVFVGMNTGSEVIGSPKRLTKKVSALKSLLMMLWVRRFWEGF